MSTFFVKAMLALALFINLCLYAYYSFSFAVRPEDMPRGTCAILAAIYFVGFTLLISRELDNLKAQQVA
jgi:hypothetical protein